jgi:hypothetical protein
MAVCLPFLADFVMAFETSDFGRIQRLEVKRDPIRRSSLFAGREKDKGRRSKNKDRHIEGRK